MPQPYKPSSCLWSSPITGNVAFCVHGSEHDDLGVPPHCPKPTAQTQHSRLQSWLCYALYHSQKRCHLSRGGSRVTREWLLLSARVLEVGSSPQTLASCNLALLAGGTLPAVLCVGQAGMTWVNLASGWPSFYHRTLSYGRSNGAAGCAQ